MSISLAFNNLKTRLDKILSTDTIMIPLALLGIFKVSCKLLNFASGIYKNVLQQPLNFKQMYQDNNSWVVITGGSDGIGLGFAEYFADLKFNIVMIARSKKKLEEQKKIIEQKYGVEVKTISTDFSVQSMKSYQYLAFLLKDLDIAILINNVGGMNKGKYFQNNPQSEVDYILNANLYSTAIMTTLILPQLLKRNKRSAIINIGSGSGVVPVIGLNLYGASKAFVRQFSNILQNDLTYHSNKVDVLCFAPNFIKTNLYPLETFVQVPGAVRGSLKALGRRVYTKGHWYHTLEEQFMTNFPLRAFLYNQISKQVKKKIGVQG